MPTLTTPTVDDPLETRHPLFGRYKLTRGITLLVTGSTVVEAQYPNQEDLDLYDFVYMGGRTHEISDDEAATLTDAGYGSYIT
jgi:hypothetical protein